MPLGPRGLRLLVRSGEFNCPHRSKSIHLRPSYVSQMSSSESGQSPPSPEPPIQLQVHSFYLGREFNCHPCGAMRINCSEASENREALIIHALIYKNREALEVWQMLPGGRGPGVIQAGTTLMKNELDGRIFQKRQVWPSPVGST